MISNKKQIEQALRLLYLIWIMIHYFLINGHCTWEVITEKRNWLEMWVWKVIDSSQLLTNSILNLRTLSSSQRTKSTAIIVQSKVDSMNATKSSHLKKSRICIRKTWTHKINLDKVNQVVEFHQIENPQDLAGKLINLHIVTWIIDLSEITRLKGNKIKYKMWILQGQWQEIIKILVNLSRGE